MKKLLALVLVLLLVCSSTMASALFLGDFNLDIELEWIADKAEKADNQVYLQIYPQYDAEAQFHPNINVVWMENAGDLDLDAEQIDTMLIQYQTAYQDAGIAADNMTLKAYNYGIVDDRPTFGIIYTCDCDYSGFGVDLQLTLWVAQIMVEAPDGSCYAFTATAADYDELHGLVDILDTLTWNN